MPARPQRAGETPPSAESAERRPDSIGSITDLPGVGPSRAARLAKLGIGCIRDLLFLLPRGLVIWREAVSIGEARGRMGDRLTVRGEVASVLLTRLGGRRSIVRVRVSDGQDEIVALFFNQPWMRDHVAVGDEIELNGRVVDAKGPALASPKLGTREKPLPPAGSVQPQYPLTDGVSQEWLAALCRAAAAEYADRVGEWLPDDILAPLDLPAISVALGHAHVPRSPASFEAARRRLVFERLVELQARLLRRNRDRGRGGARRAVVSDRLHADILSRFAFRLTKGQEVVVSELRRDLGRSQPMRRLLQGDVGVGKTALAAYAAMAVVEGGGQVAFMAPTELLAEQHAYGLRPLLSEAGIESGLLTGSVARDERRFLVDRLSRGDVQVVFGTHALFSDDVAFHRLDLAIIDEQHRFGVTQRAALEGKGRDVHLLLMTATPIPRTLALTLYGDLEVSILREAPPGRGSVGTKWVRGGPARQKLVGFLRERLDEGEQVYWVCPRIGTEGESEPGRATAEGRYERVLGSKLGELGVELVHGRIPAVERAFRLDRFRRGEIGVLVATTVIEVGVDVASATVMIIENAERLGLAQLHQLRGRVGRGPKDSWCFLLGDAAAADRFELLERSRDGFELAEEDLRRRGMGDLAGVRQSGENLEGLGDVDRDVDLLVAARDLVLGRPEVLARGPSTIRGAV